MLNSGNIDLTKYEKVLQLTDTLTREGRINKIIGMTVEATGLTCSIGDICKIFLPGETGVVLSEVVGISESTAFLMPYQEAAWAAFYRDVSSTTVIPDPALPETIPDVN